MLNHYGTGDAGGSVRIRKSGPSGGQRSVSSTVETVRGVGSKRASLLVQRGLATVEDLLCFLPRRYEDRRSLTAIADAQPGTTVTVAAAVVSVRGTRTRRGQAGEVLFDDGSGRLRALWFGTGSTRRLQGTFPRGRRFYLTGEVRASAGGNVLIHPEYEALDGGNGDPVHSGKVVPRYLEIEGIGRKAMRRIMMNLVQDHADFLQSPIPEAVCRRNDLPGMAEALRQVHFPDSDADVDEYNRYGSRAHRRLIFDELFFYFLAVALKKNATEGQAARPCTGGDLLLDRFFSLLTFSPTPAQKRVCGEILGDMQLNRPMRRLLQGDVGSGKTLVAMMPLLAAAGSGFQSAVMAPTELLAEQNWRVMGAWARRLGLKTALLTGTMKSAERRSVLEAASKGAVDIVVGTHALIGQGLSFRNLGAVVIDEQHRFGVMQRALLEEKGPAPHVLVMTATPIPRTLVMTLYGDLDVSVIDELPPTKQPVATQVFFEEDRTRAYHVMRDELRKGNRVFVVYPLVEESNALDLRDAATMAGRLKRELFPDREVALVHGRMKRDEVDRAMDRFRNGSVDILVSTTVVEVGIDIPEASVMVVEHAERFGLSQLHQLRGRVGRGDTPAFCLLLAHGPITKGARKRLQVMQETGNGFVIAEEDLRLRGPGEIAGLRQSGRGGFRIADVFRDADILEAARREAVSCARDIARAGTQGVCADLCGEAARRAALLQDIVTSA